MKLKLLFLFAVVSVSLHGQWLWDFGASVGASNYLGDIGGKDQTRKDFIADIQMAKTRWNTGAFVRYKWRPRTSFKLAFDYLRIEGDDALSTNPGRRIRNFNFRNDIFELGATMELVFYENNDLGNTYRYRNSFRAYVFGGVCGMYSNPKSLYNGEWVALRPYATEGVEYSSIVAGIPMGAGFYFTLNKRHRLGFEMSYRKTFTDYLDDISGNYPEDPGNSYERGLVLRSTELGPDVLDQYPGAIESHTWNAKRGDNSNKDSYITMSLSYSYVIRGKSSFYRSRSSGFFSKKYRRGRKIRAKF